MPGKWFVDELQEKREILQKFWDEKIVKFNLQSVNGCVAQSA